MSNDNTYKILVSSPVKDVKVPSKERTLKLFPLENLASRIEVIHEAMEVEKNKLMVYVDESSYFVCDNYDLAVNFIIMHTNICIFPDDFTFIVFDFEDNIEVAEFLHKISLIENEGNNEEQGDKDNGESSGFGICLN